MDFLLADALAVMLRASTSMLKLLQRLPASKQGASTQEVCMQLELLMDGLAQREAAVKLRASQQPAASVMLPAHLDAEESVSREEVKLGAKMDGQAAGDLGAGKDMGEVPQTAGIASTAHAAASQQQQQQTTHEPSATAPEAADAAAQQQQQQQAHEVLARMTAEYMRQLQALILQALGNRAKGLDIKNLLAPLQLNQLVLRRAEAHPVALTQAAAGLLSWKSNLAQLR